MDDKQVLIIYLYSDNYKKAFCDSAIKEKYFFTYLKSLGERYLLVKRDV